jgi:hypothetical protein
MSQPAGTPGPGSEKAHWNTQEEAALIDYLLQHKAEAGDGGNFKSSGYNAAATHIAPLLTQGPVKTGKMCKMKWALVSY